MDVAINCHLIADILRQKRIPGAVASVDAETCYDRIAHVAGSLCAQSWDVDPQAIIAMLLTIQRMKFFYGLLLGIRRPCLVASMTFWLSRVPVRGTRAALPFGWL